MQPQFPFTTICRPGKFWKLMFINARGLQLFFLIALMQISFAGRVQSAEVDSFSESNAEVMHTYASWIWDRETRDFQTCRFWKSFEIPRAVSVKKALIRITADNGYRFFLDGREIGQGGEWQRVLEYDATALLRPGTHVLAVEAFNGTLYAGLIMDLRIEFYDGRQMNFGTDHSWRVVPHDEQGWEKKTTPSASWRPATVVELQRWKPKITKGPVLESIEVNFWQTAPFQIALFSTCSLVALFCFYLMTQLAVQRKSQRLLQLERSRLARDLHDDLGARITQLVLFGELTQRELPNGTATRGKLDQLCNRLRELSGAVNEVVWVVNSQRDTLRDFANYVCNYAESFLKPTSIRCRFDISAEFPDIHFDLPVRRNLFLAVKEALNNVAKHSGATAIFLRISYENQTIQVIVEDNGKGFDPRFSRPERNGIFNMSQRMKEFGGNCSLASQPGNGCRIIFEMPLKSSRLPSKGFGCRQRNQSAPALDENPSASEAIS